MGGVLTDEMRRVFDALLATMALSAPDDVLHTYYSPLVDDVTYYELDDYQRHDAYWKRTRMKFTIDFAACTVRVTLEECVLAAYSPSKELATELVSGTPLDAEWENGSWYTVEDYPNELEFPIQALLEVLLGISTVLTTKKAKTDT